MAWRKCLVALGLARLWQTRREFCYRLIRWCSAASVTVLFQVRGRSGSKGGTGRLPPLSRLRELRMSATCP